jgi:hypothetical protein
MARTLPDRLENPNPITLPGPAGERFRMVRLDRLGHGGFVLLSLLILPLLSSCSANRPPGTGGSAVTPEERAQFLLVNLAVLNPRVAEPLVKGFSAAALERALGLVVATGLEEAHWAEGLLQQRWWLSEDPGTHLLETGEVEGVLSEVRKLDPAGSTHSEERQREIRDALTKRAAPIREGEEGHQTGGGHGAAAAQEEPEAAQDAHERRAELEDAVRWVQFTRAWSSYYAAAGASADGCGVSPEGPEVALDQAVTMSLVRPDFLDRLAVLMAEGLGS